MFLLDMLDIPDLLAAIPTPWIVAAFSVGVLAVGCGLWRER